MVDGVIDYGVAESNELCAKVSGWNVWFSFKPKYVVSVDPISGVET